MSKKSIIASVLLLFFGVVFSFMLGPRLACESQIKLGGAPPINNPDYKSLSKAFIDVSKAVSPTVVSITVTTKPKSKNDQQGNEWFFHFFGPEGQQQQQVPQMEGGSGFVISQDGYIMTNNHVVADADEKKIEVTFSDGKKEKAKIIGTDPTTDLAIIRVERKDLSVAALGNSDDVEIGEMVVAVGNPLGLEGTVTSGIVSATGRSIGILRQEGVGNLGIENFIQTDAAINPGNSGGPLVNLRGEVVGINSAIATTNQRYQGYGFAIPINLAKVVAEDLIKNGKVRRGYLGVMISPIDDKMAKALGLEKPEGALIQEVQKDGAAEEAGIKAGDVVISIDGKNVKASNELQSLIARKHPGEKVSLKIFRDGKNIEKSVTLRARNDEQDVAKNDGKDNSEEKDDSESIASKTVTFDKLGLSIQPLTADQKKDSKVDNGVVVSKVETMGEAFTNGLTQGDIILQADKKDITSTKDLKNIIDKKKSGDAILLRIKRGETVSFIALQLPKE
ncbi:MAG: Do family serine endopeptidase [Ignavibacteriales bacterium]|nr:Do family serine endopeptidase [Ignavibacteriales bacterium]